jgi:hypothetical protein
MRESSPEQPTGEGAAPPSDSGTGFTLTIDGASSQLLGAAKAELNVVEGMRAVRLEITGTGREDLLLLDVAFDGIEASMGPHQLEVGLPGTGADSARASLDGQAYQSQGGHIAVSLTAEGQISGSFELLLAEVVEVAAGVPLAFAEGEIVRSLSGRFDGRWELFCQSRMPGHSSLMRGGDYCDALVIE